MKGYISVNVDGKPYEVRFSADPSKILKDALWDIFNNTFPPGSGANKDFSSIEEFHEILDYHDTFVFYCMDGEEIAAYAILSRNEEVIFRYAKRDIVSLSSEANRKSIFWVFLFCPNGARRYFGNETKALFGAIARFVHERRGVVFFDEDPEKKLSERIGNYLTEVGNIRSSPTVVQTLQTTMLSFSTVTHQTSLPVKADSEEKTP